MMKKFVSILLLLALLFAFAGCVPEATVSVETESAEDHPAVQEAKPVATLNTTPAVQATAAEVLTPADLFERCVVSTVHIESNSGGGTGFFVEENVIATNHHVIADAGWMVVNTADGQQFNVTAVLARSENPDLALLQVDGTGTPLRLSTRTLREGDALYCIGAPMGIYPCISDGIVMKSSHIDMDVEYILSNFHAIGGNSGGPVFNAYGEVVGVVVGGMSDGPNSIDMVISAKHLIELEKGEPEAVPSREEWETEANKPDEERYERTTLAAAEVGKLLSFGRYEQDGDTANGAEEILWLVTGREGNTVTLLSLYCLDVVPYNLEPVDVTWETSHVRSFLNGEFFNSAFTAEEQAKIVESTVRNPDNPVHGTPGGNDTNDRVYLLSIEEVMAIYGIEIPEERFFDNVYAQATPYTMEKGVWLEIEGSSRCWWWMRSPGGNPQNAAEVGSAGYFSMNGTDVVNTARAIRPVICMEIKG